MVDSLLQFIAPHYCYGCAKPGTLLCSDCKYDITDEANDACIVCTLPTSVGICPRCHTSYDRAWLVGERDGALRQLIDELKFRRVRAASQSLSDLLAARLPVLPTNCVIVPVPTIGSHIRVRGYDQVQLIAKGVGKRRKLPVQSLVIRRHSAVQLGASKRLRLKQMSTAFACVSPVDPDMTYLLIDDVVTTNATLRYCAQALRDGGATQVWVAALARQPLDK